MELYGFNQGVGEIRINDKEEALLEQVRDLVARDRIRYADPKYDADRATFKAALCELFPWMDPSKDRFENVFDAIYRTNSHYEGRLGVSVEHPNDVHEVAIRFSLRDPNEHFRRPELRVIKPDEFNDSPKTLFMTVCTDSNSGLSYVDDVVRILGNAHVPRIRGVDVVSSKGAGTPTGDVTYGFAEVPHFAEIVQLYALADEMLKKAKKAIGISADDLGRLRFEMTSNANVFVREGSRAEYEKRLAQLFLAERV